MEQKWTTVIEPRRRLFDLKLRELWKYRDLIFLFVKRNFSTRYKQTVLGPLWFIIQPIITTLMNTFIFGSIAGLGQSEGVTPFLFFMAGNITWGFFSLCLSAGIGALTSNAGIFSKVYFPRLVSPISTIITQILDYAIKLVLFAAFILFFVFVEGDPARPTWELVLLPILIIQMSLLGLGVGFILSAMTTKYRDLNIFITFGIQAWMYITPVMYSRADIIANFGEKWFNIFMLNPVSPIIELFRYSTLGVGEYSLFYWGISWLVTIFFLVVGLLMFNKAEQNFIDTV